LKQERVKIEPESVDEDTARMAAAVKQLGTERSVTQRIVLSYASVLGSVGDLKARGPALLRDATGWAEAASGGLSMGVYFIQCALGWDFYQRVWGGMLTPVFLVLLTALYTHARGGRKDIPDFSMEYLVGCIVMILFLSFSSQVKQLLQGVLHFCCMLSVRDLAFVTTVFNCVGPILGHRFVLSDMSIKCFQGRHTAVMALSGVVCGVWATVPLSVVWMGLRRPGTHHDPRFKFLFGASLSQSSIVMRCGFM
jgi:hypothetical protein